MIVFADAGRSVGLVVSQILDIASESLTLSRANPRTGVIGSAVVQQRVTDLIDVHAVIAQLADETAQRPAAA